MPRLFQEAGQHILQLLLTILTIVAIMAFAKVYTVLSSLAGWQEWFRTCIDILRSLFSLGELSVPINETRLASFLEVAGQPYIYSLIVLWSALIVAFIVAVLMMYVTFLLPMRLQALLRGIAFFISSIPDVMLIFSIQLFVIWVFKQTDVLVVRPLGGLQQVYALPIFTVSILPAALLYQMMLLAVFDEDKKLYVEYAQAKGLSQHWILWKHIFRNALVSILANVQYIFWFMLSNMLIMEFLFNAQGYFKFLYMQRNRPDSLAVSLILLFIPFYLIDVICKKWIQYLTGERV